MKTKHTLRLGDPSRFLRKPTAMTKKKTWKTRNCISKFNSMPWASPPSLPRRPLGVASLLPLPRSSRAIVVVASRRCCHSSRVTVAAVVIVKLLSLPSSSCRCCRCRGRRMDVVTVVTIAVVIASSEARRGCRRGCRLVVVVLAVIVACGLRWRTPPPRLHRYGTRGSH